MEPKDNIRWTTGEYDWFFRGIEEVIGTAYYKTTPLRAVYERIMSFMPVDRHKAMNPSVRSLIKVAHEQWRMNKDPLRWLNYTIYSSPKAEARNQARKYPKDVMDMPVKPRYPVPKESVYGPPPAVVTPAPCQIHMGPQRGLVFEPPITAEWAAEVEQQFAAPDVKEPAKLELVDRIEAMFDATRNGFIADLNKVLSEHQQTLQAQIPAPAKFDEQMLEELVNRILQARSLDEVAIRRIVRDEMNLVLKEHKRSKNLPAALPRPPKAPPPPVVAPPVDPIPSQKKGPAQPQGKAPLRIKPIPATAPIAAQPVDVIETKLAEQMSVEKAHPDDIPSFFFYGLDAASYQVIIKSLPANAKVDYALKDNDGARKRASSCDYVLISRFAGHNTFNTVRRQLGPQRVMFVKGGGSSMLRQMADITERHLRAAAKRRAEKPVESSITP